MRATTYPWLLTLALGAVAAAADGCGSTTSPVGAMNGAINGHECSPVGSTAKAEDGCNTCTCTESGRWACTLLACGATTDGGSGGASGATGSAGSTGGQATAGGQTSGGSASTTGGSGGVTCNYGGAIYQAGDTFRSTDGCNTCSCGQDGLVACTLVACADSTGSTGAGTSGTGGTSGTSTSGTSTSGTSTSGASGSTGTTGPGDAGGATACCPDGWSMYSCTFPGTGASGFACHNPSLECASSSICGQGCDMIVSGRCDDAGSADSGTTGSGSADAGKAVCAITECFRAVTCVTSCGGPVVSSGCCPCIAPAFDSIQCGADAASPSTN